MGSFELPRQEQGEGIAVSADGTIYVGSEGQRAPVLKVALPPDVRAAMEAPSPAPSPRAVPDEPPSNVFADAAEDRPVLPFVMGFLIFLLAIFIGARASRPPR